MSYIDPRYTASFEEWADFMYPTLERYGVVVQFTDGDDWKSWAAGLLSLNPLARLGVPQPYAFDDWREWAMRFIGTLDQGS